MWLAADVKLWGGWDAPRVIELVYRYRVTNGEVLHGFVWESLAALPASADTIKFVGAACGRSWGLDASWDAGLGPHSALECAHAAGHGLYYHARDIKKALSDCNSNRLLPAFRSAAGAAGRPLPNDYVGLWRHHCSDGAFHAALDSLAVDELRAHAQRGLTPAAALCQQAGFTHGGGGGGGGGSNCPAGLGADEAERRQALVKEGGCDASSAASRLHARLAAVPRAPPPPPPPPHPPSPPPCPRPPPPPPPLLLGSASSLTREIQWATGQPGWRQPPPPPPPPPPSPPPPWTPVAFAAGNAAAAARRASQGARAGSPAADAAAAAAQNVELGVVAALAVLALAAAGAVWHAWEAWSSWRRRAVGTPDGGRKTSKARPKRVATAEVPIVEEWDDRPESHRRSQPVAIVVDL